MEVPRRTFNCILACILLGGFVCCSAQVKITRPPENITVHRGSDVNISCGHVTATLLPVTWIINGTSFTQQEIVNSPLYRLNFLFKSSALSLTVFSINGTTTFQCVVLNQSTPVTTSTLGTVNVIGDVTITRPPENRTVNRGSDVTISCGYMTIMALPVTWIINGRSFTQQEIMNSPLYQLNFATFPMFTSLTVFSISGTTTFQCIVQSTPVTTSTQGTIIVIGDAIITTPPENTTVCKGSDVTISCGYITARAFPVKWMINGTSLTQQEILNSSLYQQNNQFTPTANSLTVFSINGTTTFQCIVQSTPTTTSTHGTVIVIDPTPIMIDVAVNNDSMYITVSWQIPFDSSNITMYNITVMDQYISVIVTVPASMSSVEISQFPYNGTSIVANREYTITVSAISNQGLSCPSDPVVINTFILQNCEVTSPSVGTIKVSCESSHQIQVTLTCTDDCNIPTMTSGYSPLTVTGLDPGIMYSVTINVFDGNQVVLSDQTIMRNITVMSDLSGNNENTSNGGDSGGSSAGAIAGGVIGGILVVIVIIIIVIVIYYFVSRKNKESTYDDTANLKSPPGTGGTHASKRDTNVINAQYEDINVSTVSNGQDDKVMYAAPAQTVNIPHQAAASGEQYAVSTKVKNKTSEEQPPSGKYDGAAHDTKGATEGITYADLQELPIESNRNAADQEPAITYSQIA